MKFLENIFESNANEKISGRLISINGNYVGLIIPSLVWGENQNGDYSFVGPAGLVNNVKPESSDLMKSLVSVGAIIFGEHNEVLCADRILNESRRSRTASYVMANSANCGEFLQKMSNIKNGSVLVVGCGGIGSLVAMNLAGAGIGHLYLVDDDLVENSNLNRQLFWTLEDVGKNKVEVLEREIGKRFPDVECTVQLSSLSNGAIEEMAAGFSDIAITADEPLGIGRNLKNGCAEKVVSSGYFHGYSRLEVGSKDLSQDFIQWHRGPEFIGPSFGPSNTEIAGIMSSFIIQRVCGIIKSRNDGFSMQWDAKIFPRRYC
ncbi:MULTISPECIES: ThiF family adenylyltransferase [unclassified Delftia]|jgi:hypothetical protein|uniref:HesA/MoeB/ThiF family protein n=1 Tax=unclassified Delftia TaxID=2613839 RepID=UPI001A961A54|nr:MULTISPECIES: ThiF family adenylyltransferase [unclassified Delftia]